MSPKRTTGQRDAPAPVAENTQPEAPVQTKTRRRGRLARTAEVPQAPHAQPQPTPTTEEELRGVITMLTQLVASQGNNQGSQAPSYGS